MSNSIGKWALIAVGGLAIVIGGMGYWVKKMAHVGLSAGARDETVISSSTAAAGAAAPKPSTPEGPPMGFDALEKDTNDALAARDWDAALEGAKKELALVDVAVGKTALLRASSLVHELDALVGAKRFTELQPIVDDLKATVAGAEPQWARTASEGDYALGQAEAAASRWKPAAEDFGRAAKALYGVTTPSEAERRDYYTGLWLSALRASGDLQAYQAAIDEYTGRPGTGTAPLDQARGLLAVAHTLRSEDPATAEALAQSAQEKTAAKASVDEQAVELESEAALSQLQWAKAGKVPPPAPQSSDPQVAEQMAKAQGEFARNQDRAGIAIWAQAMRLIAQSEGRESLMFAVNLAIWADHMSKLVDKNDEATAAYQEAIHTLETLKGPDAFELASPLFNLAKLDANEGKPPEELLSLEERASAIYERWEGPFGADRAAVLSYEGIALRKLMRWYDAERVLPVAIAVDTWNQGHAGTVSAEAYYTLSYVRTDQYHYAEALPCMEHAWAIRSADVRGVRYETEATLDSLVRLERRLNKPQEALEHALLLVKVEDTRHGDHGLESLLARWDLAALYAQTGDWQKASELSADLEDRYESIMAAPGVSEHHIYIRHQH